MSKKLNLETIRVNSFATTSDHKNQDKVRGGIPTATWCQSIAPYCISFADCTLYLCP